MTEVYRPLVIALTDILRYLQNRTNASKKKGTVQFQSKSRGNIRLPVIAPILPNIMVRLTAMVLKDKEKYSLDVRYTNLFIKGCEAYLRVVGKRSTTTLIMAVELTEARETTIEDNASIALLEVAQYIPQQDITDTQVQPTARSNLLVPHFLSYGKLLNKSYN